LVLHLAITSNIGVKGAHHDHSNHTRQEEDNHEGVDDREPVDLVVGHEKVDVPTRSPLNILGLPLDGVSPNNVERLVGLDRLGLGAGVSDAGVRVGLESGNVGGSLMVNALGFDFESDNTSSSLHTLGGVVEDSHVDVVVDVNLAFLATFDFLSSVSQREAQIVDKDFVVVSIDHRLADSSGKVIKNPVDTVILLDSLREVLELLRGEVGNAKDLADIIDASFDLVNRVLNSVTSQDFSKILDDIFDFFRGAERKGVVGIRELSVGRGKRIDFQWDLLSVAVIPRSNTGKIEGIGRHNEQHKKENHAAHCE